jgi:hypothetical protein
LPSGKYTVFWMWDFAPFWFSSCSDINVTGSSGSAPPAPATTTKPVTSQAATTRAATAAPATGAPATAAPAGGAGDDCKNYDKPDSRCQSLYGPSSHCVSWQVDKCGKSRCSGAPAVPGCTGATTLINSR